MKRSLMSCSRLEKKVESRSLTLLVHRKEKKKKRMNEQTTESPIIVVHVRRKPQNSFGKGGFRRGAIPRRY